MTIAAGGAFNDRRDSLLMNEARSVAGRWLKRANKTSQSEQKGLKMKIGYRLDRTYVDPKNSSVSLKNRARCLECRTSRSRKAYRRV
jgi:hypothetical protein